MAFLEAKELVKEAMNEPADGATTLKKKAAEKLAAKAAPVVQEAPVAESAPEEAAPVVQEAPVAQAETVEAAPAEVVAETATEETPQA